MTGHWGNGITTKAVKILATLRYTPIMLQSLRLILIKRRFEMDWINFEDMPEFVAEVEEILEKEGLSMSEEEV